MFPLISFPQRGQSRNSPYHAFCILGIKFEMIIAQNEKERMPLEVIYHLYNSRDTLEYKGLREQLEKFKLYQEENNHH